MKTKSIQLSDAVIRSKSGSILAGPLTGWIDLDVPILIRGKNGIGKSTFLNVLRAVIEGEREGLSADGEILLEGLATVTLLAQECVGPLKITGWDYLVYGELLSSRASLFSIPMANPWFVEALTLLDKDVRQRLGRPLCELSGGTRRLIQVAVALASKADLTLLDEPFANMGMSWVSALQKRILDLTRNGVRFVIVSHVNPFRIGEVSVIDFPFLVRAQ